jgi:hypothetical protein
MDCHRMTIHINECHPTSFCLFPKRLQLKGNMLRKISQQLFGFLTKYVGTSFQLETFEKKNKKHARLTVYGEEDTFHFHHEKNDVAEQSVLTNYINSLCVDKYMT